MLEASRKLIKSPYSGIMLNNKEPQTVTVLPLSVCQRGQQHNSMSSSEVNVGSAEVLVSKQHALASKASGILCISLQWLFIPDAID